MGLSHEGWNHGEGQRLDSASETRRDCREGRAAWDPGLRSPQPSPQPQDQSRVNSTDRPSASTLIHTHWVAPGAPGYPPPHTAPSHIHTQAHTPLRCHQKVTEHTTQTTVPSAAARCDMTPRDTHSCNTHTHKTHRRPGPRYAGACREQRFIATPGNTGAHTPGPRGAPNPASATPRTCTW